MGHGFSCGSAYRSTAYSALERNGQGTSNGDTQRPARPGRKPESVYPVAVGSAILNLGNRAALEFNPVAQLPAIGRLADERYPRARSGDAGFVSEISSVKRSVKRIEAADGDDMAKFRYVLANAASGFGVASIAAELGIRREALSRGLWSLITAVVWERLKERLQTLES